MKDEKIDLSVLDPARDRQRWDRLVESVAARAWESRRRSLTVGFQLTVWARPSLAIAAAVAMAIWVGALANGTTTTATRGQAEPVFVVTSWAVTGKLPDTSKILAVLGDTNDAR
jgi:hypothetical protein